MPHRRRSGGIGKVVIHDFSSSWPNAGDEAIGCLYWPKQFWTHTTRLGRRIQARSTDKAAPANSARRSSKSVPIWLLKR
jgi:hypothetical protein